MANRSRHSHCAGEDSKGGVARRAGYWQRIKKLEMVALVLWRQSLEVATHHGFVSEYGERMKIPYKHTPCKNEPRKRNKNVPFHYI